MAVVIRLRREGKKGRPVYRIVVAEKRWPANGKYLEEVGFYNPMAEEPNFYRLKMDRVEYWLEKGAKPTETVNHLIKKASKNVAVH
ncbi:30S ribosomal protein S16 [Candidatus Methylacidiphilum fumarolicum]|uniref:Small ribosomal subunit protein bS16 n=2 Tax=Candidatus Methylacidiphilum fumarolicum TaxID=591154 RepID=I0JYK3_METFB|nr:30S ribosomal protein S16 [Candidatus Methylacidiphilum fumarolicum]MBW6415633.1 30S ribosomal protein S16 [Candidatus Methylacidiphilum fumarolicum]TFE67905.1 30S ribosomal protein S16 [Candidatus Methylacidiphilum fumarolicum]TFE71245.1 30S ribosomal protein S16 [Candidatus Methylacidiphilum fumarolicum]TFE74546.1 30S ribosomal protein S16 [Candidatus Methylacidiphilum fumarolicum]TFE74724.1 30S ribosomal protein S16 [Candidatus Methylacidiphilum fumarolicum]